MTTVQITLPDSLAREAALAGLLDPEKIEKLLRQQLAEGRVEKLIEAKKKLNQNPIPPMTEDELAREIEAYRSGLKDAPLA